MIFKRNYPGYAAYRMSGPNQVKLEKSDLSATLMPCPALVPW